jgi:3-oxoacyl-[acyl-carrier protein] reductase
MTIMTNRLAGKVAIVTGAGSGLGRAIALAFVQEGAKVVLADFNIDAMEEVSKEIQAGGGISLTMPTDMT